MPALFPIIEASCEDPDRYAFVWSDEACYGQRFGEFVQSRFFRLKDVYRAIVEDSETDSPVGCGGVFVGAYRSDVVAEQVAVYGNMETQIQTLHKPMELRIAEELFSVCVAVCKEANGALRVVHVEGRNGKLTRPGLRGFLNSWVPRLRVC